MFPVEYDFSTIDLEGLLAACDDYFAIAETQSYELLSRDEEGWSGAEDQPSSPAEAVERLRREEGADREALFVPFTMKPRHPAVPVRCLDQDPRKEEDEDYLDGAVDVPSVGRSYVWPGLVIVAEGSRIRIETAAFGIDWGTDHAGGCYALWADYVTWPATLDKDLTARMFRYLESFRTAD